MLTALALQAVLGALTGANCAAQICNGDGGQGVATCLTQEACQITDPSSIAVTTSTAFWNLATTGEVCWTYAGNPSNNFVDGGVMCAPIDGGSPIAQAQNQACPTSLVMTDGGYIAWVNLGIGCNQVDGGPGQGNAIMIDLMDGGHLVSQDAGNTTAVQLISGIGINAIATDNQWLYWTSETRPTGQPLKYGRVDKATVDGGNQFHLWDSFSGQGVWQSQSCSWLTGILSCPVANFTFAPDVSGANGIAYSNFQLEWGPMGLTLGSGSLLDGGAVYDGGPAVIPTWTINSRPQHQPYSEVWPVSGGDAGFFVASGPFVMNSFNQSLGSMLAGPFCADATNVYYACYSAANGTVSMCQNPIVQTIPPQTVVVTDEVIGASNGSNKVFSYTAGQPPIRGTSFNVRISGYNVGVDDGGGYITGAGAAYLPSILNIPTILDGGVNYDAGTASVVFSASPPMGTIVTASYIGTQAFTGYPQFATYNPTLLATGLETVTGCAVDNTNLWLAGTNGFDAGIIYVINPK